VAAAFALRLALSFSVDKTLVLFFASLSVGSQRSSLRLS
jgi:hypothetical protein